MLWLVEEPNYILGLGALLLAVLVAAFVQTQRKVILYGMAATALVTLLLFGIERMVVTERELVRAALYEAAAALQANDRDALLALVADDSPKRDELARYLGLIEVRRASIKNNLTIEINAKPRRPTAIAKFNAVIEANLREGTGAGMYPRFLIIRLRKEGDRWLILDYEHRDPHLRS